MKGEPMKIKDDRIKTALMYLLTETCDKPDFVSVKIKELSHHTYHIQYHEKDQMSGFDFKVHIRILSPFAFKYTVFDSVYGDDGAFTIDHKCPKGLGVSTAR